MTLDDPCPMTGERHLWGEWGLAPNFERPFGEGRARECRTCNRWEVDWADAQSQREETL